MRLIDADAFVKYLKNEIRLMVEDGASPYALMIVSGAINDVGRQPTVEAVPKDFHNKTCEAMAKRHTEEIQRLMPKRGEWIPCTKSGLILTELMLIEGQKWYGYKCSNCNDIYKGNALKECKFCPNCGARMKGADDD